MTDKNTPTEETFTLMGQNYKQACILKYCCYQMALMMGGTDRTLCEAASETIEALDHLTDFQAGVSMALTLGAVVPAEFVKQADLSTRLPGDELH